MINTYKRKKIFLMVLIKHALPSIFIFGITIFILSSLTSSYPFGHDESVYLTKARSWIEGTPSDEFEIYRPIGMVGMGWFFLHFNESEQAVRTFGVIFGALTIFFIFLFFKQVFNNWIAIATVATIVTSSLFLHEIPHFLNDIPSSGILIGVLLMIWIYYESSGKSKSVYFIGPLAALAFYLRYGVASALGIISVLSIFILGPEFIKKCVGYSKLKKSLALFFFLFAPHFVQSLIAEKSILGILTRAGKAAHRAYLGEGLVDYIKWLPNEIGGWVLGITAILGIIATIVIVLKKKLRQNHLNLFWIGSIGLLNFIITGLLAHAEARYVFFPMVILSGTGIASLYYLIRSSSKILADSLTVIFLLGILYYGLNGYYETDSFFKSKEFDPYAAAYVKVAKTIQNDSKNNENGCVIWALTSNRPRMSWYSKCNTSKVTDPIAFEKKFRIYLRKNQYSVVRSKLKENDTGEYQLDQNNAEKFGVILTEVFRTKNLSKLYGGDLIVYRIKRKNSEEENYLDLLEK
jgi:hypothetical protein